MNYVDYQLALTRRDDLLREANNRRRVREAESLRDASTAVQLPAQPRILWLHRRAPDDRQEMNRSLEACGQ